MCGRVVSHIDFPRLQKLARTNFSRRADRYSRSYNIGPGCFQTAIVNLHSKACPDSMEEAQEVESVLPDRAISVMRWGFTLESRKSDAKKFIINVRSESAGRTFKSVVEDQRCVILANGYYEWTVDSSKPYYVYPRTGDILYIAGVYHIGPDGEPEYAVLTLDSSEPISWLHERMPALLSAEDIDIWTNLSLSFGQVGHLLKKCGEETLQWHEVSDVVNKVSNKGEECCMTLEEYRLKTKDTGIRKFFKPVLKRKLEAEPTQTQVKQPKIEAKAITGPISDDKLGSEPMR